MAHRITLKFSAQEIRALAKALVTATGLSDPAEARALGEAFGKVLQAKAMIDEGEESLGVILGGGHQAPTDRPAASNPPSGGSSGKPGN